jgi:hypothetical protein
MEERSMEKTEKTKEMTMKSRRRKLKQEIGKKRRGWEESKDDKIENKE